MNVLHLIEYCLGVKQMTDLFYIFIYLKKKNFFFLIKVKYGPVIFNKKKKKRSNDPIIPRITLVIVMSFSHIVWLFITALSSEASSSAHRKWIIAPVAASCDKTKHGLSHGALSALCVHQSGQIIPLHPDNRAVCSSPLKMISPWFTIPQTQNGPLSFL